MTCFTRTYGAGLLEAFALIAKMNNAGVIMFLVVNHPLLLCHEFISSCDLQEEVYMENSPEFTFKDSAKEVCRLKKVIHHLK